MRLARWIVLAMMVVLLGSPSYASLSGAISTDRFGYTGTVHRYDSLTDAQAGTNLVSSYEIGNRDLSLYIVNGFPAYDSDANVIMGSWWYTTDSLGRAGYGNVTGNSGRGFLQIYDANASTDTSTSFLFDGFDGTYYTTFTMSITGENADYPQDYARFWADYQVGGADKVVYIDYALSLTAGGLEGTMTSPGIIEAFNHPTSVTGSFSGIFQNVSTTYSQNNGFYVFDLALTMENWAYENRDALTGKYGFSDSYFATTPEPGTMLLMGVGAAGAAFMRRRRNRKAA